MTIKQVRAIAYKEARQAGLDTDTSDAVSHKVAERCQAMKPGAPLLLRQIIDDEIQKHANP